jgi:dihydroorotate dehydrogenase (NAD+) catalytic subunit
MDLSVKIGNRTLANPVGAASGTFGYGSEYEKLINISRLGAIYTKAVSLLPKEGNDMPRIVETPAGLLNSIGLANVGLERFLSEKLPYLSKAAPAVIVNVAGSTAEDYLAVVERLEDETGIWGYEINLSCPNVKKGCLAFGTDTLNVESLTAALRRKTEKPLIIKLTPNVTDITAIAKAAEAGGADAVSCINTLVGMVIDINKKKPVLANGTGGLSGPAIRPVAVAAVYRVARAVKIPVIGLGGITGPEDALQYLIAGAKAVQLGTGIFTDPSSPEKTLDGIEAWMKKNGLSKIDDFEGFL